MQSKKAILLFFLLIIATSVLMIKAIPGEKGNNVIKPGKPKACKSTACNKSRATETESNISPWNFLSNRVLHLKS